MEAPKQPHAALLSSPGMGHRIPVLELARRLIDTHAFRITLFVVPTPNTSPEELQLFDLATTPPYNSLLRIVQLPLPDISVLLPHNAAPVTIIVVMMREACRSLRSSIAAMEDDSPTVLIADFFGYEAREVAHEFGIPIYLYFPTSAWFLVLTCYMPFLDKEVEGEYVVQTAPFRLPGCKPVRPEDVVDPMMDRSDRQYEEYVRMGAGVTKADGILLNTWEELEPSTMRALKQDEILRRIVRMPVYPIGLIARPVEPARLKSEVIEWLDQQPTGSVVFASFGSAGSLSGDQMVEMASGLERSGQRFVWVVRPPATESNGSESPSNYLPEGFLTRTHELGRVVTGWAPQREILAHPSVGGFLSHSGWNSTVESITNGVPMVAWPLYAEQKMNATLLTEEIGIAIRPEGLPLPPREAKVVVGREEIERVVRMVMEKDSDKGKAMRKRVVELKSLALKAISKGGCSYNKLCEFVDKCRVLESQYSRKSQK